jgi:hypothetical protein
MSEIPHDEAMVLVEREACARVADKMIGKIWHEIAAAIRARGRNDAGQKRR